MQKYKKYFVIFFVTIFSLLKLVNLHCYTYKVDHIDGKPCHVCELVLLDNNTPLLLSEEVLFVVLLISIINYRKPIYYSLTIVHKNIVKYFFSRPPPILNN